MEKPPQAPIPNPVQGNRPKVSIPGQAAAVGGPHIDPAAPIAKNIPASTSTPSSTSPASPPLAITADEASPNVQVKSKNAQKEKEAIDGAHQREWGGPRTPETMTPRGSQILESNIPQAEEEAKAGITFATAVHNNIACSRDSWGVLHITNVSTPEPNEPTGLRADSRTTGKSPKTWPQESAKALLLAISLEYWVNQQERPPGNNPTGSNWARSKIPKHIRMYQDHRSILHRQDIDLEEHFPHTVST
jgi:hypothetical protein